MGDHDARATLPELLERWRAAEPLRLYLGAVAASTIVLAVVAGWLTQAVGTAVGGVVAAVLMIGGGEAARRSVYAPATVVKLLDAQHATSYEHGAEDMLSRELGAPLTTVGGPSTDPAGQLHPCLYVEGGRRCRLAEHPRRVRHQLEDAAG